MLLQNVDFVDVDWNIENLISLMNNEEKFGFTHIISYKRRQIQKSFSVLLDIVYNNIFRLPI